MRPNAVLLLPASRFFPAFSASLGGLVAVLALAAGGLRAEVVPSAKAAIVARVLAYDRAFTTRGDDVQVLCLFKKRNAGSMQEARALCSAFEIIGIKIKGKRVQGHAQAYAGAPALEKEITANKVDVLYVAKGLHGERGEIVALARPERLRTFGNSRIDVVNGLGVAIVDDRGKVKIVINTTAAAAEGANYKAKLLQLAERVQPR